MLNKVVLCLGSNQDCEANMSRAVDLLRGYFHSIRFTGSIYTEPVGLSDSTLFLNQAAVAYTPASAASVNQTLKDIEKQLGRMPESKEKGQVPIDIDLLLWNEQVLKPVDLEKEYVKLLLRPLFKTLYDDKGADTNSPERGR